MPTLSPSAKVIERRLRAEYGTPRHHNKKDPLSELVFILLSVQTREREYRRTFAGLWKRYHGWERVRTAPDEDIESTIRFGGLERSKTASLKRILQTIRSDQGTTSLRHLRHRSTNELLAYLRSLPGVGMKTARCVLMYSFNRQVLPVDTHVWRISKRLGWISGGAHPDNRRSVELEARIPAHLRHSLHVTMVSHGRRVCRQQAQCQSCILNDICPKIR
jgi:endonuclease III